ncbi:MAG: sodium:solute symporter family protein [Rickettsiales bacterium]
MIDKAVVLIYIAFIFIFGIYNSSKVKTDKEFSGGTKYSAFIIFCTLTASYMGGGFTIGLAEKTYKYGLLFVIAMFGFSIKEILIALYIAPQMKHFQNRCLTAGDIIQQSFGIKAKIFTGAASILVCSGIIGAQLATCGNIFESFIGISSTYGTILTAIVIVSYTAWGGLKSVIKANVVHFIVLFTIIILVTTIGYVQIGGIKNLYFQTPNGYFDIFDEYSFLTLSVLFLSFFFGETLVPPYVQRLLIGKDEKETKKGTLYSGIASFFIFLFVGLIGIMAFVINKNLNPKFAFAFSMNYFLPVGLKGFGVAAMIAIIMSSADAFMNAVSIATKNDVLEPLFGRNKFTNNQLKYSRVVSLFIGLIATIFAISSDSILDILLYSYQFWTPFILVPLFVAIYKIRSTPKTFFVSSFSAILALVVWNSFFKKTSLAEGSLESVIAAISVNFIVFAVMQKLNKFKS